ncbi:putative membrane protein, clustering with ActP (plasmid) [Paraburkholderia caribensis MBA4]|uniref:Putative membrane protein, clustering with ActP n=1 Tax=Paraburkholderia caribensis MBA4 TaxID=1323664 RepID=A0A0N7JWB0_9BURK|nr:putative membrane protein, clustering with ActP [Paraburkholderia caribensis MBA4]
MSPAFVRLVARRRRLVILLTIGTLLPYYAFVLIAGFAPKVLALKLFPGSVMTISWPLGVALIVGTWILTGIYIHRANGEFDELTAQVLAGDTQ